MKKFIITGIQMRNKGSQAMFLSLYYSLKSIYPNADIVGFANKSDLPEQYTFTILPYDYYTRLIFKYRLNRAPLLESVLTYAASIFRRTNKWHGKIPEMEKSLQEADAIFDASGYTLGSGWTKRGGDLLLQTIRLARRYNKPIILMPQSFGPFDWGEKNDAAFLKQVKKELSYPKKIYAREKEGYDCLISMGLDNVDLSTDMVIREKLFPKATDIYASCAIQDIEYPTEGSVGFIVNENVFRSGDHISVVNLYAQLLDRLIDGGEKVYIVNTSNADIPFVEKVLNEAINRDKVSVITNEYSSPELIDLIGHFKYIVASRYHSIVFAYRNAVPAIILGWSAKYTDLAEHFQQQDYAFDIRKPGFDQIIEKINDMSTNYKRESQRIRDCLEDLQATSVVQQAVNALQE